MKKEGIHFGDVFETVSTEGLIERRVIVGVLKGDHCFETRIHYSKETDEDYVRPMFIGTIDKSDVVGCVKERWSLYRVLAAFEKGYLKYSFSRMKEDKRKELWVNARMYYIRAFFGVS